VPGWEHPNWPPIGPGDAPQAGRIRNANRRRGISCAAGGERSRGRTPIWAELFPRQSADRSPHPSGSSRSRELQEQNGRTGSEGAHESEASLESEIGGGLAGKGSSGHTRGGVVRVADRVGAWSLTGRDPSAAGPGPVPIREDHGSLWQRVGTYEEGMGSSVRLSRICSRTGPKASASNRDNSVSRNPASRALSSARRASLRSLDLYWATAMWTQ